MDVTTRKMAHLNCGQKSKMNFKKSYNTHEGQLSNFFSKLISKKEIKIVQNGRVRIFEREKYTSYILKRKLFSTTTEEYIMQSKPR